MDSKGFTLIELLISMAVLVVVLAGLTSLFAAHTRSYTSQYLNTESQGEARTAIDFITRNLRLLDDCTDTTLTGVSINEPQITESSDLGSIEFMLLEDFGFAGSSTTNTLTDSTKAWTANELVNAALVIAQGTGIGQIKRISANTATTLTVADNWTVQPDSTSGYKIASLIKFFRVAEGNLLRYSRRGTTADLARNITQFRLQRYRKDGVSTANNWTSTAIIKMTVQAQTRAVRPDQGTTGTAVLTSFADLRN